MIRVGVLGSGRGTSLQPVLDAIAGGALAARVVVVISQKPEALILERARQHGVPAFCVATRDREMAEAGIKVILQGHAVDVVLLVGWMRILSDSFVHAFENRIFNVHPSLLPAFAGGMNEAVHEAVLASGCRETGCSVHRVTGVVDGGEVVMQKRCPILPADTVETLKRRVQGLEGEALIQWLANISLREKE